MLLNTVGNIMQLVLAWLFSLCCLDFILLTTTSQRKKRKNEFINLKVNDMEMVMIVSAIAFFALCGVIYFKYQDYKAQQQE